MSGRDRHIQGDRLTALALVAHAPESALTADSAMDRQALDHVAACAQCAGELARLTSEADRLREAAFAEADQVFDDTALDTQRSRILDRLAHLGQAARVLRFPARTREVAMPVSTGGRRWVSVAAAAGLIIGLLTGQVVHFVPWDRTADRDAAATTMRAPSRSLPPALLPATAAASATAPSLTDDELLDEIEAAVQLRRATSLRALDALTPTAADFRDLSLGR